MELILKEFKCKRGYTWHRINLQIVEGSTHFELRESVRGSQTAIYLDVICGGELLKSFETHQAWDFHSTVFETCLSSME